MAAISGSFISLQLRPRLAIAAGSSSFARPNLQVAAFPKQSQSFMSFRLSSLKHIRSAQFRVSAYYTVEGRVREIVAVQLQVKVSEVISSASFVEDLGAESLDLVELIMALEDEFYTEIPDEEAEKITTVQAAIDFINASRA